jgi:hypothetical protein
MHLEANALQYKEANNPNAPELRMEVYWYVSRKENAVA